MDITYEHRLTEVDDRSKNNERRLDDVEKRLDDNEKLISTVAVLASKQETMESDVKEVKSDVKSLINKPAQRWEGIVEKAILMLVAAVVSYLLARIGL